MTTSLPRLLARQKIRFAVVGIVNTAFSYGVYALLLALGLDYRAANLVAVLLGILFSFRTQGTLVFRNGDTGLFPRYVVGWVAIYLLSTATIGGFVRLGASAYVAGLLALPVSIVLSYLVQKHWIFVRR